MREQTFRAHIINRAWKLSGLVPLNAQIVLDQMELMSTPEPEPATLLDSFISPISYNKTPETILVYKQFSSYINNRLASTINKTLDLSPTVARAIEKRDKGARIMLFKGLLADDELFKRKEAEAEKATRRARGNRQVQKYRVITVSDARLKVMARDEAEDRRIEVYNLRQEEKEMERRAIDDRKEKRLERRQAKKDLKEKRLAEREAKAVVKELADREREAKKEEKALEKSRKETLKRARAAIRLANTQ